MARHARTSRLRRAPVCLRCCPLFLLRLTWGGLTPPIPTLQSLIEDKWLASPLDRWGDLTWTKAPIPHFSTLSLPLLPLPLSPCGRKQNVADGGAKKAPPAESLPPLILRRPDLCQEPCRTRARAHHTHTHAQRRTHWRKWCGGDCVDSVCGISWTSDNNSLSVWWRKDEGREDESKDRKSVV